MLEIAQEFFKRNPDAKSAHVVLDRVFDNAHQAELYRRAVNAHKVSSYLRSEYDTITGNEKKLKQTK